jgi:predicted  nucleic acid-binding Zn-ribbon protein
MASRQAAAAERAAAIADLRDKESQICLRISVLTESLVESRGRSRTAQEAADVARAAQEAARHQVQRARQALAEAEQREIGAEDEARRTRAASEEARSQISMTQETLSSLETERDALQLLLAEAGEASLASSGQ